MYIKIKTKYEVMFCEVAFWIFEPRDDEQLIMETQTLYTLMLVICQPQGRPALKHTLLICVLYLN